MLEKPITVTSTHGEPFADVGIGTVSDGANELYMRVFVKMATHALILSPETARELSAALLVMAQQADLFINMPSGARN